MVWYNWKRNVVRNTTPQARWKRLGNEMAAAQKRLKYTKYDYRGRPTRFNYNSRNNPYRLDQTRGSNAAPAANNIGTNFSVTNSKTNIQEAENGSLDSKTLYQIDCTFIPQNVASNDINNRENQSILLKGIRIDAMFRNQTGTPMYVRCALINRKNGATPSTTDFFRGYGTTRSADFDSGGNAQALRLRSDPINPDEYNIFKSWAFTLSPSSNETQVGYNASDAGNWRDLSEYVKFNRYLTYDGGSSVTCTQRIFFVYWVCQANETDTFPAVADAFSRQMRVITYFKDA
jgi:hypothetical protein